ncbi:FAST kinase domain-containing protein 5, mitochondrial-like [Patiria miniata]|uniref:RAP domain-containing protein n=1 Tax=Patiria miniata TaxID=46514 RepID=A0A914AXI9_PATMI|nr:FAST kinase domain-containing protein 5, mitochondrial-like [Patiria miniata]
MSWRRPHHVVRLLRGPMCFSKPTFARSRTLSALHTRKSWFCSDTQHLVVATSDCRLTSSKLADSRREEQFQPGLFHVDISSFRTDEQGDNRNNANSNSEQFRKRSYINYGTHLDPVVFRQLGEGWVLGDDGARKEVFHPKLTPRLFYREADEYSDTAVISPQVAREEIGSESRSKQVGIFLEQFKLETGIGELDLRQLLETFLQCSDEFLLGLASDTRFIEFTEFLSQRCPQLPTDEFVKVLVLFARVQVRAKISAVPIFLSECESRFANWDVPTSLLVCDAWRLIGLKVKSLNTNIFSQIEPRADQLTKHQVVQLMYLIGENRFCQESLRDNLQDLVLKHLDSFTLTELGTVCQGFFKSKTNLKPSVVSALAMKIQSQPVDCIHSFYLVGMLKVFRQAYFGHRDLFNHVADSVSPHLHTYPITSIMHILLTYATLHIHNDALLGAGSHALLKRSHECRCKDLSKFLWSFATLNYHPENSEKFFKTMIGRLVELLDEFEDFPVFLVSGLLSLAYLNIYPAELLNLVFSRRFLLKIDEYAEQSNIDPMRDMFLLHCAVTIECPDYHGNQLGKNFFLRKPFSPRMFGSLPYELSRRPLLGQVASSVASVLGGEKYIKLGFTLPHMKTADIEIRLDPHNSPIPISDLRSSSTSSSQFLRDKVVHLDPSLITNLSGKNDGRLANPTGNRTASSDPTGNTTASSYLNGNRTASSNPTGNRTASSNPTVNKTASSNIGNRTASSDPTGNRTASHNPTGNRTASDNPTGNKTASSNPTGNKNASSYPTGNRIASSNPAGDRTASSTSTGTRIADEPETTGEARMVESRHLNAREPQTPSDKTLAVDKLVFDRAALFARKNAASGWSSRFDVPEPLCTAHLGGNRIAVLVWSRNHFHFNGKKLLGLHSMKRRQLQKLGYKTVEIPFFEWDQLTGSEERENYIRLKLFPDN